MLRGSICPRFGGSRTIQTKFSMRQRTPVTPPPPKPSPYGDGAPWPCGPEYRGERLRIAPPRDEAVRSTLDPITSPHPLPLSTIRLVLGALLSHRRPQMFASPSNLFSQCPPPPHHPPAPFLRLLPLIHWRQ